MLRGEKKSKNIGYKKIFTKKILNTFVRGSNVTFGSLEGENSF